MKLPVAVPASAERLPLEETQVYEIAVKQAADYYSLWSYHQQMLYYQHAWASYYGYYIAGSTSHSTGKHFLHNEMAMSSINGAVKAEPAAEASTDHRDMPTTSPIHSKSPKPCKRHRNVLKTKTYHPYRRVVGTVQYLQKNEYPPMEDGKGSSVGCTSYTSEHKASLGHTPGMPTSAIERTTPASNYIDFSTLEKATSTLQKWHQDHNKEFPDLQQLHFLSLQTGLPIDNIRAWFQEETK